jgi:hypothetical protein
MTPPVRIITPNNPNSTATPPYAAPVMNSLGSSPFPRTIGPTSQIKAQPV